MLFHNPAACSPGADLVVQIRILFSTRQAGRALALVSAMWLAASAAAAAVAAPPIPAPDPVVIEKPADRTQAARFLTQATRSACRRTPTSTDICWTWATPPWIDEHVGPTKPVSGHRTAAWEAQDAAIKATWTPDQRNAGQDVACSTASGRLPSPARTSCASAWPSRCRRSSSSRCRMATWARTRARWPITYDMLADKGTGNYRQLLEGVSRHPTMGGVPVAPAQPQGRSRAPAACPTRTMRAR